MGWADWAATIQVNTLNFHSSKTQEFSIRKKYILQPLTNNTSRDVQTPVSVSEHKRRQEQRQKAGKGGR